MFDWFKSKNVDEPKVFTPEEIEFYLLLVYHGIVNKNLLSSEYHAKIAAYFEKALFDGYGGDLFSFGIESKLFKNVTDLRRSLYVFSAAKQYSQVREMSAMINVKGEKSEFSVFKEKAVEVFDTYNKNYLKTEFNTAIGQ